MPPINLLIKPASSACNMRCTYCFYNDVADNRNESFMGMMSQDTLEKMIVSAFEYADHFCGFAFQGGEPTMAGLPFFKEVVRLQKLHNHKNLRILNAIQTNGYVIDDEWAQFFHDNNFLVGLSLDGDSEIHNLHRIDSQSKGTFNHILKACNTLKKHKVEFNILSVVTGRNAKRIRKTYQFFKKQGFRYLQFIPCLEPIQDERGTAPYHLSVQDYAKYLVDIFNLWYEDFINGEYISIRHIDNLISIASGQEPEVCNMRGCCSVQAVVEGNGSVYPCDFYVLDKWKLGTIGTDSFESMMHSSLAKQFVQESMVLPDSCKTCSYVGLCRNGCKRDRILQDGVYKNYYCDALKLFYNQCGQKIMHVVRLTKQRSSK